MPVVAAAVLLTGQILQHTVEHLVMVVTAVAAADLSAKVVVIHLVREKTVLPEPAAAQVAVLLMLAVQMPQG